MGDTLAGAVGRLATLRGRDGDAERVVQQQLPDLRLVVRRSTPAEQNVPLLYNLEPGGADHTWLGEHCKWRRRRRSGRLLQMPTAPMRTRFQNAMA